MERGKTVEGKGGRRGKPEGIWKEWWNMSSASLMATDCHKRSIPVLASPPPHLLHHYLHHHQQQQQLSTPPPHHLTAATTHPLHYHHHHRSSHSFPSLRLGDDDNSPSANGFLNQVNLRLRMQAGSHKSKKKRERTKEHLASGAVYSDSGFVPPLVPPIGQ